MFHTHGGRIDQTAIIGHAPEHRDWKPGDDAYAPNVSLEARVEAYVTVDAGTERRTFIGPRAWLMKHVHVGHDAIIQEDCEVSPGAVVCGGCIVGKGARVGANAVIRPGIEIGAGARIGCGAVVVRDVPAGETWAGNPARRLVTAEGAHLFTPEEILTHP